jgi:hypothetical protein
MSKQPARQAPVPPPREPFHDRALELLALFALIAASAVIYHVNGPVGFPVVMSASGSLYAAWKRWR